VTERFDADELAAAARLDRAIDAATAGHPAAEADGATAALVEGLLRLHAVETPPGLPAVVRRRARERARDRASRPPRMAACALAAAFLVQATGSLLFGPWVAAGLRVPFDGHALFESGVAVLALAGVLLAGALARRWLDVAAAAGVPVGLAFAVHGLPELAVFPAGAALHLAQGAVAVALGALWWRWRRDVSRRWTKRGA
jgi:hypothetical protein